MTASHTIATDGTKGRYIASFSTALRTMTFNAEYLFKAWLYQSGGTTTEYDSSSGWTINEVVAGDTTTITATLVADTGVILTLSITNEAAGIACKVVSAKGSATRSVYGVQFPNIALTPTQLGTTGPHFHLAHPYASGFTMPQPHSGSSSSVSGTDQMQFLSFFDDLSQLHLYVWTDDELFCPRIFGTAANGTYVAFSYVHFADRRFAVNTTWTRDYSVRFEMFYGKAIDGRYGAVEAALRYRVWAADASRPWRSRGLWKDASNVSSFVKDLDFHVTLSGQQYATRWLSDLVKWKTTAGFAKPLFTVYSWKNPGDFAEVFDPEPTHAGAITATTKSLIDTLQTAGWRVMPFVHPHLFDSRASAGWLFDNWTSVVGLPADLSAYMMQNKSNVVREVALTDGSVAVYGAGDDAFWDFASVKTTDIGTDVATRIGLALAPSIPGAFYVDALGSVLPATPATDPLGTAPATFQDNTSATGWTHSDYMTGMGAYLGSVRDLLRLSDAPSFLTTEWPSEWSLPYVDIAFDHANHNYLGAPAGLFQIVHGDAVRGSSFGMSAVSLNSTATSLTYVVTSTYQWLRSGVFAYNDGLDLVGHTVFGAGALILSDLYYYVTWATKLLAMKTVCLPYFQGNMTRPMLVDWRADLYEDCLSTVDNWKTLIGTDSFFMAETWQRSNGEIGVIAAYAYPGVADFRPVDSPPVLTLPSLTKRLCFVTSRDGLPSGSKAVYKTVDGGARTLIDRFQSSVSFDVTFAPWTVTLIEVVSEAGAASISSESMYVGEPFISSM